MLRRVFRKAIRKSRRWLGPKPHQLFPLCPPLPLPPGAAEPALFDFFKSIRPANANPAEMAAYCSEAFRRCIYTYGLARSVYVSRPEHPAKGSIHRARNVNMPSDLIGNALELGANPYFMTVLLKRFSSLNLTLANYFGPQPGVAIGTQGVLYEDWNTQRPTSASFSYHHFNMEQELFPFPDAEFDVVFFCEILEHLQHDPLAALGEIKRVLKPAGRLILTTPNVARLENRARLLAGLNIYDPYSAHGVYARHNREYTQSEIGELLKHAGFAVDVLFTADVHENRAFDYLPARRLTELLSRRAANLGQYLFCRAVNEGQASTTRPEWLYRAC